MLRRKRLSAVCAACAALFASAAPASAFVTTDLNWELGPSYTQYGGGTQFHISQSGDGSAAYRWLDNDLTKTTVISGNGCGDGSTLGTATIGGGDTDYHTLFFGAIGQCFILEGKTTGGTTIHHDARLRR